MRTKASDELKVLKQHILDGQLDAVEFAGFRSVIRSRAVKNAQGVLSEYDTDKDGRISSEEAEEKVTLLV
jgi:5-hydroxyisourate hydrolase-like protein (transthyretin family)